MLDEARHLHSGLFSSHKLAIDSAFQKLKEEPRKNSHLELEQAIEDFRRRAEEKGYDLTYEEAREFDEGRM